MSLGIIIRLALHRVDLALCLGSVPPSDVVLASLGLGVMTAVRERQGELEILLSCCGHLECFDLGLL